MPILNRIIIFIPMNYYIFLIFIVLGTACNTSKELTNQDNNNVSNEKKTLNLKGGIPNQESRIPGGIIFKAKVLEVHNTKQDICGVSRRNVVQLEVIEILEEGSSLTKIPATKELILVHFIFNPNDLKPTMIIQASAKESRCRDSSKSYFTVNSHEIIE